MPCQFYHNPALVETVISALSRCYGEDKARQMLARFGFDADQLFWALRGRDWECIERILIEALNSDDFTTEDRRPRSRRQTALR
jgi:hypothetical protein